MANSRDSNARARSKDLIPVDKLVRRNGKLSPVDLSAEAWTEWTENRGKLTLIGGRLYHRKRTSS